MVAILQAHDRRKGWVVLEQSFSTNKFEEVEQAFGCPHCQMVFQVRPGSGRDRGFCMMCNKPTCGKKICDPCRPWELQMEIIENRRSLAASLHLIKGL